MFHPLPHPQCLCQVAHLANTILSLSALVPSPDIIMSVLIVYSVSVRGHVCLQL